MQANDKVQVTQNAPDYAVFAGQTGEIEKVDREDLDGYPFHVRFDIYGNDLLVWFRADELAEVHAA